jgi:hypothetical protein
MDAKTSEGAVERSRRHVTEAEARIAKQKALLAGFRERGHTDFAHAAEKDLRAARRG